MNLNHFDIVHKSNNRRGILFVQISKMKLDNFYHLDYSDY